MNLLPFVAIFILAITLAITSLFQDVEKISYLKIAHNGLNSAYRNARNSAEESRYLTKNKNIKKASDDEKNLSQNLDKKLKKYIDRCIRENITENSKFNILPLLKSENPTLEKIFVDLLKTYYLNTSLFHPNDLDKAGLIEKLAKEILKSGKNLIENEDIELKNIYIKDKRFRELYYKMLKGSPNYPKKNTFPPLEVFFIIKKSKGNKVIHAKKAPIKTMHAFFGKEISDLIFAKEQDCIQNELPFLKEDILKILREKNFPRELENFIHYGFDKILKRTEVEKDEKSGIQAELSYHTKKST